MLDALTYPHMLLILSVLRPTTFCLAGSADHTVRFWSVSTSPTAQSYTGEGPAHSAAAVHGPSFDPTTLSGS